MKVGSDWTVSGTTANAPAAFHDSRIALLASGADGLLLEGCRLISPHNQALALTVNCQNVTIRGCEIRGGHTAVRILSGDHILLQGCTIVADNTDSGTTTAYALFFDRMTGGSGDEPPRDIVAQDCRIEAASRVEGAGRIAFGVSTDTETFPRVVNCQIKAHGAKDNAVYGAYCGAGVAIKPSLIVMDGTLAASTADPNKTTEVWDLYHHDISAQYPAILRASGVSMSKWSGPIEPASGARSVIQRTLNASQQASAAVLALTNLTAADQEVTSGLTNPDVYRALSVTSNTIGLTADVYIVGTDWAGSTITEKITLQGVSVVAGQRPFRTVTKVILPAQTGPNQQVAVGTTNKLGLYYPIAATSDVQQQARKASAATSFTIESVGTVDATYSTVTLGSITSGDSFEWAILASN
ncbi:MAG: right-handed parallel beta-helix repeat-containing protein, partial [Planctomycetota bacterium]